MLDKEKKVVFPSSTAYIRFYIQVGKQKKGHKEPKRRERGGERFKLTHLCNQLIMKVTVNPK